MTRSLLFPALFGIMGVAILVALGTWQLQRLDWKRGIIAEAEQKMAAEPVPVPASVDPGRDHRLHVTATGYLERAEIHVLMSTKASGPGYRVIVPMELARDDRRTGRRIMVDLGFVPERLKSLADREPPSVRLQKRHPRDRVTGYLYWPDEVDSFTPPPDRGRDIWFARDVAAMAEELGTEPVLLVSATHPDGDLPRPMPPGIDIPNRHLEYVLTWYGLAIVWATMTLIWIRRLRRSRG